MFVGSLGDSGDTAQRAKRQSEPAQEQQSFCPSAIHPSLREVVAPHGKGSPGDSTYPISSPASICLVLKKAILGKRRS